MPISPPISGITNCSDQPTPIRCNKEHPSFLMRQRCCVRWLCGTRRPHWSCRYGFPNRSGRRLPGQTKQRLVLRRPGRGQPPPSLSEHRAPFQTPIEPKFLRLYLLTVAWPVTGALPEGEGVCESHEDSAESSECASNPASDVRHRQGRNGCTGPLAKTN
jgi:hypothetical protein